MGALEEVTADFYVAALPVEIMQGLVTPELTRAAPSLSRLGELRTEWMNGIQFYLETDEPLADGHAIYLDSNWALTSISQRQFWRGYDLSAVRRRTRGRHSLGRHLELDRARELSTASRRSAATSREEIKNEVWAQLKAALNAPGRVQLEDGNLVDWFLDPDIQLPNPGTVTNLEPLLINHVGSLAAAARGVHGGRQPVPCRRLRAHLHRPCHDGGGERGGAAGDQRHPRRVRRRGAALRSLGVRHPYRMRNAQRLDQVRFRMGLPNLFALGGREGDPAGPAAN